MIVNQLIDTTKTSIQKKLSLIKVGMKFYNTLVPDINYSVVNPLLLLRAWQWIGVKEGISDPGTSPSSSVILSSLCDLGRSHLLCFSSGMVIRGRSCFQL